jgi:hypothetical protein
MSRPIQLQAILGRVATKSDNSLSLTFSTPEFSPVEMAALFSLTKTELTMLLTPNSTTLQAPIEVKGELSNKTQGQRIRSVIFCLWKQQDQAGKMEGKTFDQFYQMLTNKFIEDIKSQLEPN